MIEFGSKNDDEVLESLDREIMKVEGYLADLRAIRQGEIPRGAADAPLLDDWSMSAMEVYCLVGIPMGHPDLSPEERTSRMRTADIRLVSPELGLARTLGHWFRLGQENPQDEISGAALWQQVKAALEERDTSDEKQDAPSSKLN